MTYGMTYIVRPFIEPSKSWPSLRYASSGAIQLLFGPASSFVRRADEGQVLDAGDVGRVGAVEVAAGQLLLVERDQDPGLDGQRPSAAPSPPRTRRTRRPGPACRGARTPRPRRGGAGWRKGLCRRRPRWRCSWRSPPRGGTTESGLGQDPYHNRRMSEPGPPLSLRLLGLYPKKAGSAAVGVAARARLPRLPPAVLSSAVSRPPTESTSPRRRSPSPSTSPSSTSSPGG